MERTVTCAGASHVASGPLRRRNRRGANAIEFALVAPVLMAMMLGVVDYGWYFFRESLVTNALRTAVRSGSILDPADGDGTGECTPCSDRTAAVAVDSLGDLGITVTAAEVTPAISNLAGTCAVELSVTIPHDPLVGFIPVPQAYAIQVVSLAQNISGC